MSCDPAMSHAPGFLLLLLLLPSACETSKLSAPRVLLPFCREVRVSFSLGAGGGCYSWFSTRPDVVTVTPLYTNGTSCSQMALLSSQSTQPTRLSSVIIAEEQVTGHLVRCDAIVDVIHSIEIVSRSRELYVDDSPLELTVRALDSEGNTFSSLSGIAFEWSVVKDDETEDIEPSDRIRILKYSEAEYSPPDYIADMELEHKQGDLILVSGIRTGAGVIKVRLLESFYKNVAAAMVRLLVLENIFLLPSLDIHLLVGAYIKYRVSRIVQGKITEVSLPLEHYDLQLREQVVAPGGSPRQMVAQLDIKTVTVTALQLGRINLVFIHKNIHMRGASGLPNCTIHVVEPGFLGFAVFPGDRWVLETNTDYEITVEVYDKFFSNKVYLSDNLRITLEVPAEFLEVTSSSVNGSHYLAYVLQSGVFVIKARLIGVLEQDGTLRLLPITVGHVQEVKSFHPIVLTPGSLAFPHHPCEVPYRHPIQVEGGSGNFTWTSSNQTVAMVTMKGVVTTGVVMGQCVVQARDLLNPHHYGEVQVHVVKISKIELIAVHADVEISQSVDIPLAMYGIDTETRKAITLTDCSLLALEVILDKQDVFSLVEGWGRPGPAHCTSIQLVAESSGYTLVTAIAVVYEEYFDSSVTIASYEHLKVVNPVEVALVTLHSVKEMVFEGGPWPWVLEPSRFFLELRAETKDLISMQQVWLPGKRKQSQYIYRILCLDIGEQVLTFRVGNKPGVLNPSPAVEMVQATFICALPASMSVSPVYELPDGAPPCPLPQHSKQLVPVSSSQDVTLELAVFDQHRQQFDNFSSLLLKWQSSNESLAGFASSDAMQIVAKDDGTGQTRLHGHMILQVKHRKGTLLITVNSVGYEAGVSPKVSQDLPFLRRGIEYLRSMGHEAGVSPEDLSLLPTSAAVELLLVEDVSVVPPSATIFNHPDVKEVFYLVEGSGYFLVNVSDADIVTAAYQEAESCVQITPANAGTVTLAVYDLCLASRGPALVSLRVSDIMELELDLVDKIEVGKTVSVTLRVLDAYKHPLPNKYFKYMDLRLQAASPIATLMAVDAMDMFCASFLLRAVTVGQTTLVVTARDREGRRITSTPRQVEVFPPFRLVPDKIMLIPQNMMQVMSEGGPQPQSVIHFSISNVTVAAVNHLGQVTGLEIGVATVQGTIRAVNEDTGKVIVFSQDSVEVEVVQLRGVRIHAPATRLITGTKMPVYVLGLTSMQTPFSFSNSVPQLEFHWSMSKRDVIDLVARHAEVPLSLLPESSFSAVVHTRAAGRTGLKVTVRCQNMSTGQFEGNTVKLSDEVQILVFEKLQLFSPLCPAEQILMSMSSQLKLYTNREGAAFVSSRLLQCSPHPSVIQVDRQGLLTAGAITGAAVLEVTSLEHFGVNQTAITGVQVAPVSYLRVSTSPRLHTTRGSRLAAFPLGMALTFTVHFYDRIGEKFHAQNTRLHLAMNRDDLLLIGPGKRNYTYAAQAVNPGVTLLGIWDQEHPGMADYIPIVVEHAITPDLLEPITVGDVICFSTALVNKDGEAGLWHISSSDILDTDTTTGAAVARSAGKATIFYDIPGIVKTYREVVVNSSTLVLDISPKNYLTNTPNSTESQLLIATSQQGLRPCSPAQAHAIMAVLMPAAHLSCTASFTSPLVGVAASSVFQIHSQFNIEKGVYICVIRTSPQPDAVLQSLSTADTLVSLEASLIGERGEPAVQRLHVPFLPAFYSNQTELVFSSQQLTNEIHVLGVRTVLEEVQVLWDSPGLVVASRTPSPNTAGMDIYLVEAVNISSLRWARGPILINLSCSLTGQLVPVVVKASRESDGYDYCSDPGFLYKLVGSYQTLFFTLCAGLALTAVVFIAYNAFLNRVQTAPVVYVPTVPGYVYATYPASLRSYSGASSMNRLRHWLWSARSH